MSGQSNASSKGHFPWKHIVGFALSILLTLAAFWVVSTDFTKTTTFVIIMIFAVIQAILQLVMFMHITEGEDGGIISGNTLFAFFIAIVIVVGTVFVMHFGMHGGMSM